MVHVLDDPVDGEMCIRDRADAGREKAAREEPHLPPDVVSSTGKIHFLYRIKVIFN